MIVQITISREKAVRIVLKLTNFLRLLHSQAIKRKTNIPIKPINFCNINSPDFPHIQIIQ